MQNEPETSTVMDNAEREPTQHNGQLEEVAKRLAGRTAVTTSGELDLMASVGGLRGIAEAIIPALVFLVAFILTTDIWTSAVLAVGLAALASLVRVIQKQPLTQALAGVLGVAVSAAVALLQDDARGYYVIGFYISAAYGAVFALSMAVKWPIMGLIYGWIRGEGVGWQKDLIRRRKYQIATALMVLVFAARLMVQLPMYWAHDVVALGTARLVMGVPLYALVLWFGWLLSRPVKNSHMTPDQISSDTNIPGESGPESKV